MRVLILGEGGISQGIANVLYPGDHWILQVSHASCDVRDYLAVRTEITNALPDWVINCAGVSRKSDWKQEVDTNLTGSINVAMAATSLRKSCILIASVAGLYGKPDHIGYSASKAGVISVAQALGLTNPVWAISPGRVDTPMRERDYPDDTPGSRLHPEHVGLVVRDIMAGLYPSGTNVVIRKVGLDDITVERHDGDGWREKLRVGQPKTI